MSTTWTNGDSSGSQTLTGNDHLYAAHVNEIRTAVNAIELKTDNVTAAQLAVLGSLTASAAELNILDGATLSTTELNYVDGVTSAVQTQLDAKAPIASPTFTGTVTLPTGLTGVIRADTGVVSVDSDVTDLVSAASTSAAGKVELTIVSEVDTGTSTTLAITPDSLAGSDLDRKSVV